LSHRLGSATLSREAIDAVRRMLAGENVARESTKLSAREWRELMDLLAPQR
jgi:thymidylate synthase (FAD)